MIKTKKCSECANPLKKRKTEPKATFEKRTTCSNKCRGIKQRGDNFVQRQAKTNRVPTATLQAALSAPLIK